MKTVEVKIYELNELKENVREKVINRWRDDDCFMWSDQWIDSLNAFADYFNIRIKDYSVCDYSRNFIRFYFEYDEDDCFYDCPKSHARSDTQGVRLFKMLNNRYSISDLLAKDCPMTGYCGDEDLLRPIREFMQKPDKRKTFYELIDECLDEWLNGFQNDYEYWISENCILDEIEINEIKFLENGEVYHA